MNSLFLDTKFFLDILETSRERHEQAKKILNSLVENEVKLYTSSDIISTVSYFLQKRLKLKTCIKQIDSIVKEVGVLSANSEDFIALNAHILDTLKEDDTLNIDYEDCMQLYLSNKYSCEYILTSDKKFCRGMEKEYSVKIVNLDEVIAI